MAGDGELRANWNKALVEELAATCYSRVLVAAKGALGGGDAYEALWPTGHTVAGSMWRGLADSLMRLVKPLPLLKTRLAVGGGWVAPQACVVWAAGGVGSEEGGSRGDDDEGEQRALAKVLLAEKVRTGWAGERGPQVAAFSSASQASWGRRYGCVGIR